MDARKETIPLARFACDFCKGKKIKCSRELPKCAACKPWPGPCHYSRQYLQPTLPRLEPNTDSQARDAQGAGASSLPERLDRIEASLEKLTNAVNSLLAASKIGDVQKPELEQTKPATAGSEGDIKVSSTHLGAARGGNKRSSVPSHISSLNEAHHLGATLSQVLSPPEYGLAVKNLKDLSEAFTSFRIDTLLEVPIENDSKSYLVPDSESGYEIMAKFRSLLEAYRQFFEPPSEDVLNRVIFRPSEAPAGWVVLVNYSLLTISGWKPDDGLASMFRWNVRLALQNASLFLLPSRTNLQALMLLAFHGEEFSASPNISWMLASNLCLQAQALTLHKPGPELDEVSRQRQLALFWAIFNCEKACVLAFGRPTLLPTHFYREVELPSFEFLARYTPLLDESFRGGTDYTRSAFGAYLFLRNTEMSQLIGEIIDCMVMNQDYEELEVLMDMLDTWYSETKKNFFQGLASENGLLGEPGAAEKRMFGHTLTFRYLHSRIVLTKNLPTYSMARISWARQAIDILHDIMSSWDPIYNGIIWQLLYYPFTPFLVLFGHVVNNPKDPEVQGDLQLLLSIPAYFAKLRSRLTLLHQVASRLKRTAEVFTALARRHVEQATRLPGSGHIGLRASNPWPERTEADKIGDSSMESLHCERGSGEGYSEPVHDISLDDIDIDRFLSWIPESVPDSFSSGTRNKPLQDVEDASDTVPQPPQGQKRPFDAAFDWFSWEKYYSDC